MPSGVVLKKWLAVTCSITTNASTILDASIQPWDAPAPLNLSGILRAEELPTKHMKPVFPFTQ